MRSLLLPLPLPSPASSSRSVDDTVDAVSASSSMWLLSMSRMLLLLPYVTRFPFAMTGSVAMIVERATALWCVPESRIQRHKVRREREKEMRDESERRIQRCRC